MNKINFRTLSILFYNIYILFLYILPYTSINNVSRLILFICLAFLFLHLMFHKRIRIELFSFTRILLLIYYLFLLSFSQANSSFQNYFTFLQVSLLFLIPLLLELNKKEIFYSLYVLMLAGIVMYFYTFNYYGLENLVNNLLNGIRIGQEINQINIFGYYSSITLALSIYFAYFKNHKYLYLFSIISVFFILATQSRKSLLILILIFLFYSFYIFRNKNSVARIRLNMLVSFFFISLIIFLVYSESYDYLFTRFFAIFQLFDSSIDDGSLSLRVQMLNMFLSHIDWSYIIGNGIDSFINNFSLFTGNQLYSHNNFVEIIYNNGVIFSLIYYFPMGSVLYAILLKKINLSDNEKLIFFLLLFSTLIDDFTNVSYLNKYPQIILGLMYSLINYQVFMKKTINNLI